MWSFACNYLAAYCVDPKEEESGLKDSIGQCIITISPSAVTCYV